MIKVPAQPPSGGLRINLGRLLERQAALHGERPFVTEAHSGRTLSYAGLNRLANRIAHGLAARGLGADGHVAIMLTSGIDFLACSYALKKLGVVEVAVNATFRGVALARMLAVTGCRTLITAAEFAHAIGEVLATVPALEQIVVTDHAAAIREQLAGVEVLPLADVTAEDDGDLAPAVPDTDTAVILFTSGTTGVSKGCAIPHRCSVRAAESMIEAFGLGPDDCVYSPYPMFHVGATQYDLLPALMVGGRAVVRDRFSISAFWPDVVAQGVTWFMALGSVQQLLWAAPPCEEETRHRLRFLWGTPLPVDPEAFERRFGVKVVRGGGYGSTDAGSVALPLFEKRGAGRVLDRYEVAIVDEADDPLPAGTVGELVVRSREPAIMASGYVGMPEETVRAWRNLWFHTGDLAWLDDEGDLHFHARVSERLRVRGEMVSAYEIEEVVLTHPAVEDCAVIGLPDGAGEENVHACVTLRPGTALEPPALREYCAARMSRYMVPATVAVLDEMPRTPSGKPAKAELKARALALLPPR